MANRHRKGDVAHSSPPVLPPFPPVPPPGTLPEPTAEPPPPRPRAYKTFPRRDEKDLLIRFGQIVRAVRNRRAFSQFDLAERADMHRAHISLLEGGRREARLTTICAIAKALRVNPGELMPVLFPPEP